MLDKKATITLSRDYMETLALLTRMRLEFCEEAGGEEYAEEAADLRAIAFALAVALDNAALADSRGMVARVSYRKG